MKLTRKAQTYIEAVRERNRLVDADPEAIPGYWLARKLAVSRVPEMERKLTGGELGAARRTLAAEALAKAAMPVITEDLSDMKFPRTISFPPIQSPMTGTKEVSSGDSATR